MVSSQEQFFLDQARSHIDAEELLGAGYFRTPVRGRGKVGVFIAAAKAGAYFIALTPRRLVAIRTRAPATSKPLLENQGVEVLERSEITGVEIGVDTLVIRAGDRELALAPTFTHKYFPRQTELVEALQSAHGDGRSMEEIRRTRRGKQWLRVAVIIAAVIAGLIYGLYAQ